MYDLMKTMLAGKRKTIKTQTEEACMMNAVIYSYQGNGESSDEEKEPTPAQIKAESETETIQEKMQKRATKMGVKLEESEDEEEEEGESLLRGAFQLDKKKRSERNLNSNTLSTQNSKQDVLKKKKLSAAQRAQTTVLKPDQNLPMEPGNIAEEAEEMDFNHLENPSAYHNQTMR